MKKVLCLFISIVMIMSTIFCVDLSAYAKTSGDFEYVLDDGTAEITDYAGSATDLTIPSTIDGYTVTSIAAWAFGECTSLTSVTIPDSVTSIGEGAFFYCTSLTSIDVDSNNANYSSQDGVLFNKDKTKLIQYPAGNERTSYIIPNSVTSIDEYAFCYCTSLESITIPNSVTSIGDSAFDYCTSLTSVTIPDSVTSIGSWAFYDCTSLESITIPNSVTSIDEYVFYYCTSLKSVTIPNSVTSIGDSAFYGCTSLESITIPDSVTSIGNGAFDSCTSLTSIDVDSNNANYSSQDGVLFNKDKTKLIQYPAGNERTSYIIPNSVTSIRDDAFYYCTSLTSITIPDSVTSIGELAFVECTSLTSLTIPDSVTSIDEGAFECCSSLTSVTIGNNVTSIDDYVFYYCTSLTSVTIPDSVTSIGDGAFYGCTSLTDVYYSGAISDWSNISIGDDNSYLTDATIHCTNGIINEAKRTNHIWDSGVLTQAATTAEDGIITYTCTVCGETKTEVIASPKTVTLSKTTYTYSGSANKPTVTVKDSAGKTIAASNYTVSYSNNINVGTATVKVTFKGNYSGSISKTFKIIPKNTSISSVTAQYKGFTVKLNKYTTQTTGYQIQYSTSSSFSSSKTVTISNTTTSKTVTGLTAKKKYYVRIRTYKTVGSTKYYSSWSGAKTVTTSSYPTTITLSASSYTYDGKVKKPTVTVKNNGTKISSKYYTVSYSSGRKNVGTYTVTIKFKAPYSGTVKKTFTIKPKATTLSSVTAKSKGFTVKWKKLTTQTTGYQIQYSTNSSFSSAKTVTVTKNSTTSKTVTGLTGNKKYYVRIRTYKTVSGTKYYSSWSKAKTVTVKK